MFFFIVRFSFVYFPTPNTVFTVMDYSTSIKEFELCVKFELIPNDNICETSKRNSISKVVCQFGKKYKPSTDDEVKYDLLNDHLSISEQQNGRQNTEIDDKMEHSQCLSTNSTLNLDLKIIDQLMQIGRTLLMPNGFHQHVGLPCRSIKDIARILYVLNNNRDCSKPSKLDQQSRFYNFKSNKNNSPIIKPNKNLKSCLKSRQPDGASALKTKKQIQFDHNVTVLEYHLSDYELSYKLCRKELYPKFKRFFAWIFADPYF